MNLIGIVLALLAILVGLCLLIVRHLSYFKINGIPSIPISFPMGNLKGIGTKLHFCEMTQRFYMENKHRGPILGLYYFLIRVILVNDLDLIRNILIKDAHIFNDRNLYYNERDDPMSAHLFCISGPKWKNLRSKLTPTFTSGKMRFMFSTVIEVSERLRSRFEEAAKQPSVEIKDLWARYSTDVIGSCAFGIECNTLFDKNTQFREMGRKIFEEPRHGMMAHMVLNQSQSIGNLLRIKFLAKEPSDFFESIVKQTIRYREGNFENPRKDFMSLMVDLKHRPDCSLTDNEIAAHSVVFFLAGFETSSSLLTFCSYELGIHLDIQERARQEVDDVLRRYNGELTYEGIMEMKYCEQVLNESLRMYPPVTTLSRSSRNDYPIPGTKLVIPAGVSAQIPVFGIHRDPDIYPDPDVFDPERFTTKEIAKRHPMAFLPFGEGPRNCIGLRFGMMQARIGLVTLLRNYRFKTDARMSIPLNISKTQTIIACDGGVWLNMTKRDK